MEYIPIRVSDIIRQVNRDIYLPAIQRELVWGTDRIERLFDSIMADFPIGSFLFWLLEQKNKDQWPVYEFIQDFDEEFPHNPPANMAGITKDLKLVLDGQQRITSLLIGLGGKVKPCPQNRLQHPYSAHTSVFFAIIYFADFKQL